VKPPTPARRVTDDPVQAAVNAKLLRDEVAEKTATMRVLLIGWVIVTCVLAALEVVTLAQSRTTIDIGTGNRSVVCNIDHRLSLNSKALHLPVVVGSPDPCGEPYIQTPAP
jgi:hypothetical protein